MSEGWLGPLTATSRPFSDLLKAGLIERTWWCYNDKATAPRIQLSYCSPEKPHDHCHWSWFLTGTNATMEAAYQREIADE